MVTCDVPDPMVLQHLTLEQILEEFQRTWGEPATRIVLPAFSSSGPFFENSLGFDVVVGKQGALPEYVHLATNLGLDSLVSLELSGGFLNSPLLHIQDTRGTGSPRICLNNRQSREILKRLVREMVDALRGLGDDPFDSDTGRTKGFAIDACDFWPMGATDDRIDLTCFCPFCTETLRASGVEVEAFWETPSPANLALADTGTGIEFVEDFSPNMTPEELLSVCRRKGFLSRPWAEGRGSESLTKWARMLITYFRARSELTVAFMNELFSAILNEAGPVARVVIAEDSEWNWTTGAFFDHLDDKDLCDELWFCPSLNRLSTKNVDGHAYMWSRARYLLDHMFGTVWRTGDSSTVFGTKLGHVNLPALIQMRIQHTMAGDLSGVANRLALPIGTDRLVGYVGAALNERIADRIQAGVLEGLASAATPGDLHAQMMEALKRSRP